MIADVVHLCPRCRRGGGQPYRAVPVDDKTLRVLLRCDGCRHRWSAIVPADSLSADARARISGLVVWPGLTK